MYIQVFFLLFGTITLCKEFIFDYKSHMIPHPDKAHRGGEDAFFDSEKMLVISDGVGGWNTYGIDPSKYSRFLCSKAGQFYKEDEEFCIRNPRGVMKKVHDLNDNLGSATMVVTTLDGQELRMCYLGDSGVMVIRQYENQLLSIYQFVEQQHQFNFPYQLSKKMADTDKPQQAICMKLQLEEGDIVVVGSDGLFDNVSYLQVLKAVQLGINQGTLLTGLPEMLAKLAIDRGKNQKFNSPFAQRAKELGLQFEGGKLDDTTVIIARVVEKKQTIEQL